MGPYPGGMQHVTICTTLGKEHSHACMEAVNESDCSRAVESMGYFVPNWVRLQRQSVHE